MNLKSISLFVFLFISSISLLSAQAELDKRVLRGAKMLTNALHKKDYTTVMNYMHPNVLSMAGGAVSLQSILKESAEIKENNHYKVLQTTTLAVGEYIEAGEELHTIVQQEQILKLKGEKFKTDKYLLAISADQGKNWYYVDLEAYNQDNIKIFFPNFNANLRLPKTPQAVQLD